MEGIITMSHRGSLAVVPAGGKVVHISPDTLVSKSGTPYYRVRIVTDKTYFGTKEARYDMVPGVIVQVGIHIGEQSVLEYMFAPFLGQMGWALSER